MDRQPDKYLLQSLEELKNHRHSEWGDRTPMDVFNRLLAKHVKPPGWTKNTHYMFSENQIQSRQEQWSTERLAALRPGHAHTGGVDIACPIIVVEFDGEQRLLDGNHRVNRWKALGDKRPHPVNIHTVTGSSAASEYPGAA